MPILEVEIVLQSSEVLPPNLARELADQAAAVFDAGPGTTWVRLRELPAHNYAENGGTPAGVSPVFVSVLKRSLLPLEERRVEAARLAVVIAALCGRPPENVHILYLPVAAGRMAFGGEL